MTIPQYGYIIQLFRMARMAWGLKSEMGENYGMVSENVG
jgi:hypothetical protein